MPIDFKKLQEQAQKEIAESSSNGSYDDGSNKYKFAYLGQNGKVTAKIFYNPKMGGIQRKIVRHTTGDPKVKVPCLSYYGEECPICKAIKDVQAVKGQDSGVFMKYGYKTRGACYAQLIDFDANFFTESKDPKRRDIVLLMYPKTIYDKVNQEVVNAGENLDKLVGSNSGLPLVFQRTQNGNSYDYNVSIYPFGESKSFETDEEFDKAMDELPNLGDVLMPEHPNDEIRQKANAVAQAITSEYFGNSVVNPTPVMSAPKPVEQKTVTPPSNTTDDLPFAMGDSDNNTFSELTETKAETTSVPEGMPPCFGKHNDTSNECMMCPCECECVMNE